MGDSSPFVILCKVWSAIQSVSARWSAPLGWIQ